MNRIILHGEEITNLFDLLGKKENDLTYSLGWVLSKCSTFLKVFIKKITGKNFSHEDNVIRLQEFGKKDKGFTDIEIVVGDKLFCIIEAKIGWNLPTKAQLKRYISRFKEYKSFDNKLVVISECKKEYAKKELDKIGLNLPIEFISWQEVYTLIEKVYTRCGNYEKKLLNELETYLNGVITMRDTRSNMVYCVSLGQWAPEWSSISWIDIVEKKKRYFYPVGKGWPPDPPNYIAFRYDGKLQSIHHVESYEIVTTTLHSHIPEIKDEEYEPSPLFLLKLGPSFKPKHEVKNGKIWPNGRYWCMLDALFTCKTIKRAVKLTKKRLGLT